jgi:hypothetical protein
MRSAFNVLKTVPLTLGGSSALVAIDLSAGYTTLNWRLLVAGLSNTVKVVIYAPDMSVTPLAADTNSPFYVSGPHSNTFGTYDGGVQNISGLPMIWVQLQSASAISTATLDVYLN